MGYGTNMSASFAQPSASTGSTADMTNIASLSTNDLNCINDNICTWIQSVDTNTVQFTVLVSEALGWGAVGFGNGASMTGTTMFILYNVDDTVTVSHRTAESRSLPTPQDNSAITVLDAATNAFGYGATFNVQLNQPGVMALETEGNNVYIWATGSTPPDSSDIDSSFGIHDGRGSFSFNPATGAAATATSALSISVILHGAIMIVAWLFLTPVGIIIARYFKPALGVWWFRLHMALMLLAVASQYGSFGLIFSTVDSNRHLTQGYHAWLGILVLGMSVMQTFLGFIIDRLFDPDRKGVPLHDKLHWWVGRLNYIFAGIAIGWGIWLSGGGIEWYIGAGSLVGLSLGVLVVLQFRMGQQHHKAV